ncbi:nuclear transport factor 2 family protein [Sphingomonas sp. 1P06PA]|uniref:nuclear transport factor 2 family protein n=1 Tax=Sphingomonas sp. 1P06PA TaxID=554121 RepID=UPI0039A73306
MSFTGPWRDRLAIRELIDAYSDAVMVRDADAWGACWAEDAYWSLPEFADHEEFVGREAIVAGWVMSMTRYASMTDYAKPMIYVSTPGAIAVEGDRASARVYTSELYADPATGIEYRVRGLYDDEIGRIGGDWLFTRRIYRVLASHRAS